jgi:hypothetical protein
MLKLSCFENLKFVIRCFAVLLLAGGAAASELAFPVGEKLVYSISWNGIPVAWSEITTQADEFEGREVIAIRMRSRTYPFFNWFFKADDQHESLIDPQTMLPLQFTKNLREGRYRCHEITRFDHEAGLAHYEHQTNGSKKTYPIDEDTRDILSFMYSMRAVQFEPETTNDYQVMADEKVYDLSVRSMDVEPIDLPNYDHDVDSLALVPEASFDGLFVRKGQGTLWVSRDPRRILTFAKMKVPFGRVRITLQEVQGPGDDFWITDLKETDD